MPQPSPAARFAADSSPADLLASMPYAATLGITVDETAPELVRGSLGWSPEPCAPCGLLHGGAVMSLADRVGAVCALLNLPPGAGTATVESATNFFRVVRDGTLHAEARPLHVGRSFIGVRTDLTDDAGRPVGQTTQTQAVLAPRPGIWDGQPLGRNDYVTCADEKASIEACCRCHPTLPPGKARGVHNPEAAHSAGRPHRRAAPTEVRPPPNR